MKIKRKDYEKQLIDEYWRGIEAGINFALDNPKMAEKYRNNTQMLKSFVDKATIAFQNVGKAITKAFQITEDDSRQQS